MVIGLLLSIGGEDRQFKLLEEGNMRKGFLIVMAVLLVAVLAAPAMAGMDASGFIRVKSYMSNFYNASSAPVLKQDAPTAAYVEQRLRTKFSFGEENVKAVWFLETDFSAYGDSAGGASPGAAARNVGGALGGDKINLETKNIYLWFKLPNTSLDFTVGLASQSDGYAGLIYGGADMAGIFMTGKYEPVTYKLGWAKLYENDVQKWDDLTLYIGEVNFAPTKGSKMGVNFYIVQDDTQNEASATNLPFPTTTNINKKLIYNLGFNGTFNAGPVTLTGFALYNFGEIENLTPGAKTVDVNGYALDLRAEMKLGPGKGFLEGIYISGGDNTADEFKSVYTLSDTNASPGGNSAFGRTDMLILLFNGDGINTSQALIGASSVATSAAGAASQSPSNNGRGMWHIGAGYTMPLGKQLTTKFGIGYLSATELFKTDKGGTTFSSTKKGEDMGTEVNANLNYNIMKGLDFGVYGAYAWLGDFYKSSLAGAQDPDDVYDIHLRLNYAF
jgi:hypothetical protein